jgi:SAM-dependent methyltransferase
VLDADLVDFVLDALPRPPARVLEIGAGSGELAEHLRGCGYEVVAIDPAGKSPTVEAVPLLELDASVPIFDAALAVLSLHHVKPLAESCERLAAAVRPGGVLVIDEFDIRAFDLTAAQWWLAQRPAGHPVDHDPGTAVADMRSHLHVLDDVLAALSPWFDFSETRRGPYLYRWGLEPTLRAVEEAEIAGGALPATGARTVGRRRA